MSVFSSLAMGLGQAGMIAPLGREKSAQMIRLVKPRVE